MVATGCADRAIATGEVEGDGVAGDPCGGDEDCVRDVVCFNETCVGQGDLRVSLSWDAYTDFDLHVNTPAGEHLHYAYPSGTIGALDVDDCVHGDCRDPRGTHVENVFFPDQARRGAYEVWVVNYDGVQDGRYEIEVAGAVSLAWDGWLPAIERYEGERIPFAVR